MEPTAFFSSVFIFFCLCLLHLSLCAKYSHPNHSFTLIAGTCLFSLFYYLLPPYVHVCCATSKSGCVVAARSLYALRVSVGGVLCSALPLLLLCGSWALAE
eukprot:TRINITY_DN5808_c0_g2_i5.p3 TRINITY_DN5808_c0_g2~~TRINITY_DN5808_c0_g2_i5.p3  ORF type:complete len:101 (+),score=19.35 TRINITY_DN5808_c0_g2_i5:133-435(+)